MRNGEYLEIDGRPALRFVREIPHPAARVWTMLTDPAELARWFPATPAFEALAPGATVRFTFETDGDGGSGTVLTVDEPRRFVFTWSDGGPGDELAFDLAENGEHTVLTFTTLLEARDTAARNAAGWELCLDALVGGSGAPAGEADWQPLYEAYVAAGVPAGAGIPRA